MIKGRVVLLVTILAFLAVPTTSLAALQTNQLTAASLAISVNPPNLPADGQSYAVVSVSLVDTSGQPTIAFTNTTVFLSTSLSNVGTVPYSVTIPAGQTFVTANFTTTATPGVATLTASSPGLAAATTQVTTKTASGFPDHINVFAAPSVLLTSPSNQPSDKGVLVIELTDDQGLPAKAASALVVQLFSSDASVVDLPQAVLTIPANQTLTTGTFQTSFTPGNPTITASASGFVSGSAVITVEGPEPLKLITSAQPTSSAIGENGLLMIALTDQTGDPARAPSTIVVTLRSSNTSVATIPPTVIIPAGSIYAWANYSATSSPGAATLTATSPGLQASSSVITTFVPGIPTSLKVLADPSPLLSDSSRYNNVVVVELMDKNAQPAVSGPAGYTVTLISSSSIIGSVPSNVTIPAGSSFASVYFQSTYASGSTLITASATNLLPSSASIATYGPVPFEISLSVYGSSHNGDSTSPPPGTELPADGESYPALVVTLLDSSGSPAVAPSNLVIQLSSSKTDVVSVNSEVTISQGEISAVVPLQTSLLAGVANITASSVGLVSGSLPVTTEIPAPAKLAAYLAPAVSLQPLTGNTPYLYVQLQDASGNPARARQATPIVVTSSNSALFNGSMNITIPPGADYATLKLDPAAVGTTTLTVTSSGLASSTAKLQVLNFPFSANVTLSSPSFIYANQTELATLRINVLGTPMSKVNVTWSYGNVVATPVNGTTNAAGEISTVLRPAGTGLANVTATGASELFGKFSVTAKFVILATPAKPARTLVQVLFSYIYYIVVAIAAVVVAAVFLLRRRRRHAKAELEAGFEAVS